MAARSMSAFFKENVEQLTNEMYVASKRIKDENGKPVEWELRHIPNKVMNNIKKKAMNGSNAIDEALDMCVHAVIYPDLRNSELQDSYGVKNSAELLLEMLTSAELDQLELFVMEMNGYTDDLAEMVDNAKN